MHFEYVLDASQTSSEEEWMNRDTVKPTVTFGSSGIQKGDATASVFSQMMIIDNPVNHVILGNEVSML